MVVSKDNKRMALMQPEGYVFVVTYGRSGSTVVQSVLNTMPGYCIRGENGNALLHMYKAFRSVERTHPLPIWRKSGNTTPVDEPFYGAELIDLPGMGRALCNVFVRDILKLPEGTRIGGFKEIRYVTEGWLLHDFLNFAAARFPNLRFVFNTRNHDSVMKSAWWKDRPEAEVRGQLQRMDKLFADYAKAHPERCIALRYEDFNGNPAAFKPLFDFLGETFDEAVVASVLSKELVHGKEKQAKT